MASQPWKQAIAIYILPNTSRSKAKQTMKCGQLKEYYIRNFFLKNYTQNAVEKLFPDLFLKHQN